MFKRKYPVLLLTPEGATFPDYRRAAYTTEGLFRLRLVDIDNSVLILHPDGSVKGSNHFSRWEPLS